MVVRSLSGIVYNLVRQGLRPGSVPAYSFAVACVLAAAAVRMLIDLAAPNAFSFAIFFPGVLIATLVGGLGAGVFATLLGAVVSWFVFIPPRLEWSLSAKDHFTSVCLFLFAAALIVWAHQYRVVLRQLAEEEEYRKMVVDELGHRVKNKLATIHAILRHELRGHDDVWKSVSGRLQALSAADDFIVEADGQGVDLRRILEMEMEPYGAARITMRGEPLPVYSKLPSIMALMFHELATNSAKYGALSSVDGRVDISWSKADDTVSIIWTESGGPKVTPPSRRSFGSNLIERSLDGFGGKAKIEFAETGVICWIRLPKTLVAKAPEQLALPVQPGPAGDYQGA